MIPIAWLVAFASLAERRLRGTLALIGGLALATGPWFLRNAIHFGTPTLSLTRDRGLILAATGTDPFFRFDQFSAGELARADPLAFLPLPDLGALFGSWRAFLGEEFFWLAPLFLLAWLDTARGRDRALWLFSCAGLVATVLVAGTLYPGFVRFYWPFVGLMLVVVVGILLGRLRELAYARVAVPIAVLLFLFTPLATRWQLTTFQPLAPRPELEGLPELVGPDALVASNVSWVVAWRAGLPAVRLRAWEDTFARLDRDFGPVDAVFMHGRSAKGFGRWLATSPLAERFTEARDFAGGSLWLAEPRARSGD